jgi:cytochrome c5
MLIRFTLLLAAVLGLLSSALAGAGEKAPDGKALYKENCRVCHDKGSPNGEFSPLTLIQDQWRAFFKDKLTKAHGDAVLPSQPGKKLLDLLTPEQLKAIQKFVVDHAADSEHPQTCG